jgi:signal transduction histidine kinase/CheY-like chemotaxis protein
VIEMASLQRFNPVHEGFLEQLTESIGIVINTIEANTRTEDLLKQSQSLAHELQQTNQELQEKARLLAHQNQEVERKNREVEQARQALEEKAEQLALTSKYKSEFLANMSHELRTPLNSLLILSDQLCKNAEGNLTTRQVEYSKTIHSSGNDLLMLINDILDLSKIESGTVAVDLSELRLEDLQRSVERSFRHFADSKHLGFGIEIAPDAPKAMLTDVKRLQQIIKNLLSNAFKFTHHGHVQLRIAPAPEGWMPENEELRRAGPLISFAVSDTGIGIPAEKQQIIFEAFQQADGSTSRKYGGTGLGLAISRELSKLLGGELRLASAPGEGSTFTLVLPQTLALPRSPRGAHRAAEAPAQPPVLAPRQAQQPQAWDAEPVLGTLPAASTPADGSWPLPAPEAEPDTFENVADDDRHQLMAGDCVLLIVENDLGFARVMLESARQAGFKGLVCTTGASALGLACEYRPSLLTLDIHLPDMPGWRILERLRADARTRHLPVCVISTDDAREQALQAGALCFLSKPLRSRDLLDEAFSRLHQFAQQPARRLLVALPEGDARHALAEAFHEGVDLLQATDAASVRAQLQDADALVIDAALPGCSPEDVREAMESHPLGLQLPVVLWSPAGADGGVWERQHGGFSLRRAGTVEELLGHASLALHRSAAEMDEAEAQAVEAVTGGRCSLRGRKALIVDDDMRNIFALATVLDDHGMEIVSADNGREAIRMVESDPSIEIVLMDIMMPEMDGLTTMQHIRQLPRGRELPMVAVTAKAMKGDRQKCIEAGAWDYLSKPVDPAHLLGVLKGWLCR